MINNINTKNNFQAWADEHLLEVRALNEEGTIIETILSKPLADSEGKSVFAHEVIFVSEYLTDAAIDTLNAILAGFGYRDINAFREENSSLSECEMYLHLAALIAEHRAAGCILHPNLYGTGIIMDSCDADRQAYGVVEASHNAPMLRHALCKDCSHYAVCQKHGELPTPDAMAFNRNCQLFDYTGSGECFCVRSKSEATNYNEPLAYIVAAARDIPLNAIALELKQHRMLKAIDAVYSLLAFHTWNSTEKAFDEHPKESLLYSTFLLLEKVDEAMRHNSQYEGIIVKHDKDTGMIDIDFWLGERFYDCYAKGVVSRDSVIEHVLAEELDRRGVKYEL